MTDWISAVRYHLQVGGAEVMILGELSAQELVAWASDLSYAPEPNGVMKPIAFMGCPVVPAARWARPQLVELHSRETFGPALVHVFR